MRFVLFLLYLTSLNADLSAGTTQKLDWQGGADYGLTRS